jgi:hypothetical protein
LGQEASAAAEASPPVSSEEVSASGSGSGSAAAGLAELSATPKGSIAPINGSMPMASSAGLFRAVAASVDAAPEFPDAAGVTVAVPPVAPDSTGDSSEAAGLARPSACVKEGSAFSQ